MFAVIVDFVARPGMGKAVRDLLKTQAANSVKNEDGCHHFDVCGDPEDEHRYMVYELYDGEAAIEAHRATDYYATFRENLDPIIVSRDIRVWKRL